jgi:TonB-linked SusC/RagA family outer membrane protein
LQKARKRLRFFSLQNDHKSTKFALGQQVCVFCYIYKITSKLICFFNLKIYAMRCNKYLLMGCIFLLSSLLGSLWAQGSISGKVSDPSGAAVEGATVFIQAIGKGGFTDENGKYTMSGIPAGEHTLTVRMLGYVEQNQTVTVENGKTTNLNVTVQDESLTTDEVVVVGYGVNRKRDLVGSVEKINSEDLNDIPGGSFETALQGKVPGINITQTGGAAGAGSVIRVRGIGSLTSDGSPLIVIDGIPIIQNNFINNGQNAQGGGNNSNPLAFLNPNDIESISVLKDASAAAIYGSRGANGVIIITTKRGEAGKTTWNFNSRVGISRPVGSYDMMNTEELLQIRQEAWENDGNVGRAPIPAVLSAAGYTYDDIRNINTDWEDLVTRTGFKQEYNLSMRTGTKKVKTYLGLGYLDGESFLVGNTFERISGRANVDFNLSEKLTLSVNASLARGLNDKVRQGPFGGLGQAWSTALPMFPVENPDGSFFNIYGNPVAAEQLQDWNALEWRTINNFRAVYKPIERLDIVVTGNMDYMSVGDYFLEDSIWTTIGTIGKEYITEVFNGSTFGTATYDFGLKNDHDLSIMGGIEYQENTTNIRGRDVINVDKHLYRNPEIAPGDTLGFQDENFLQDGSRFFSVFGRLNYKFKDRYLAQLTFRRDGSSRFAPARRFGNFPALGLGWIASEENFIKKIKPISYLKFGTSYGITGNATVPCLRQFDLFNFGFFDQGQQYNGFPVRNQVQIGNDSLQWEVNKTWDAGIELGLFNDRVTLDVGYFDRETSSAILNVALQASSGIDDLQFPANAGTIRNWGWEFEATTRNLVGAFQWTTRLNATALQARVLDVGTATPDALAGGFGDTRAIPGEPFPSNFIVRFSHVDPATGAPVYLTANGEETTTYSVVGNRVPSGTTTPWLTGGISNEFTYKDLSFSFLWNFSLGGKVYDDASKRHMGVVTEDWNMRREYFDRWQRPGDNAMYPRATMSMLNWGGNANFWQNNHTLWLEDGSFARLRTVDIGYNIKPEKAMIRNIRLSLQGTNLLTITNYRGPDPEVARERSSDQERNIGGIGVTFLTTPNERTVSFGVNVDF